ncbi:PIN domain-containing protein, partial [Niastella yeongjuensis]
MMYIVIDTCILEKLINDTADDWSLDPLHQFITSGQLQFLAPTVLKSEWEDHKKKKMEAIQRRKRTHRKERELSENLNIFDAEKDLTIGEKRILRQVEKLDTIVVSSPTLERYHNVILLIDDLKEQKAPPFFHSTVKQNEKDAKIIFTCLEYAKRNGIKEFTFVSENIKEFASKDKEGELHLNIQKLYPDIVVHFFISPYKAVDFLKQAGLTLKQPSAPKEKLVKPTISVDNKLPILDQLFQYLSVRLKDWSFLPKSFIVNQYPFVIGKYSLEYPVANAFATNNDELFSFLQSLSIDNGQYVSTHDLANIENNQQKISDVLGWFRTCGIHKIIHVKHGEFVLPFIPPAPTCTCYACKWNNQEYSNIRKDLMIQHDELKDKMDQAYAAYELSEYRTSINILLKAIEQAKAENNYVRVFICQYNIRLLKQQHNHTKFGNEFPDPLEKVDAFDIEDTIHVMPMADQEIARWLNNGSIYDESSLAILQDSQQMRKALRNKRTIPFHRYHTFFEKFNSIWRFLSVNRIVGDQLAEFNSIYQAFQEGIFQILALDQKKGNDKISLYVQHLFLIVRYGDNQGVQNLITEYKLTNIPHHDTDSNDFIDCLLRLIDEVADYPASEFLNQGPQYFREQMNRMLDVYVVLCQNIGLSATQINTVAQKILQYSRIPSVPESRRNFTPISHFLSSQSAIIDKRVLLDFVILYIQNGWILDFQSAELLLTVLEERNTRFTLAPESSKTIHALVFQALVNDDADQLIHLLRLTNMSSNANDVVTTMEILTEFLNEKFLPHCYAVARTLNYLTENSQLFDTYLKHLENHVKNLAQRDPEHHFDRYGVKSGDVDH